MAVVAVNGGMGACCCPARGDDASKSAREDGSRTKNNKWKWSGCCGMGRVDREATQMSIGEDEQHSVRKSRKKKPKKFVALWDYKKYSPAELSFQKGDVFKQFGDVCDAGPEWIFVVKEGRGRGGSGTGYIPRDYVAKLGTIEAANYYFGELTRFEAESILFGYPEGTFLVRKRKEADEEDATYALAVAYGSRFKHYKIYEDKDPKGQRWYIGRKKFRSVEDMISWHQNASARGICCMLINSPPRPPPPKRVLSAQVEKNWQEIDRSQITIKCEIGKGHFGIVYRASWQPTDNVKLQVAVKELKTGAMGSRDEFLAEAVVMKNLVHENLVRLLGVVSADEPFWIVTEYITGGSLKCFLVRHAREMNFLTEPQLVDISLQVSCGMQYLEMKGMVHRDLAARNVLIQAKPYDPGKSLRLSEMREKYDVKIADFGLAQMVKEGSVLETRAVSVATKWAAPEALKEGRFSIASDVWSFGILLHEIFTHGEDPYAGMATTEARKYVVDDQKQLERSQEVPEKIYTLMSNCLAYNYDARPTFAIIRRYLEKYYAKPNNYEPYMKNQA